MIISRLGMLTQMSWLGLSVRTPGVAWAALAVWAVAGCTGTLGDSLPRPSTSVAQPSVVLPAATVRDQGPTYPGSAVRSEQPIAVAGSKELTCSDSTEGNFEPAGSLIAGDVVFEGLAIPGGPPPTVAELNIGGAGPWAKWHFRKVVLYVKPNAAGRFTIAVDSSDQALAWVPADKWGTTALDIAQWASRSTTIAGCGGSTSSRYFGGILASNPNACVHLTVAQAGGWPDNGCATSPQR